MKTIRIAAVLMAVAMAGVIASPASMSAATAKTKTVAFKGSYSGTASLLISGKSIKVMSVKGRGSASVVGAGTLSGTAKGTSNGSSSCVPFNGSGAIKGASGTIKLSTSISSAKGCSSGQSGPVTITITGTAKATGGTGKAKGANGNLRYTGKLHLKNTTGSQSGSFNASISGKLTVNK